MRINNGGDVLVGDMVKSLRCEQGLTQRVLAVRAGTTQAAISLLENDAMSPTMDRLEQVLQCLGMQLHLAVVPLDPWTDQAALEQYADMTPSERVIHGTASSQGLAALVGQARDA